MSNESDDLARDGYSVPVYGIADGTFLSIHIPALCCLSLSFICVIAVVFYSFYHQKCSTFFEWSKSERFAIYMALCDGLYNITHFADHLHIVIAQELPKPKSLCDFYGFLMAEFITAQNLMVCIVAVNVFVLIYFRIKLNFGKWDHRLLIFIFGSPAIALTVVGSLGQLGPNGSFCYFDGVNGKTANTFFTAGLLSVIMITNIVLYILSWIRLFRETKGVRANVNRSSTRANASYEAAKTMSLFVAAFFIQWWALLLFGIWLQKTDFPPQLLFHFVTTFSNFGGVLNGIVFIFIIRRKQRRSQDNRNTGTSGE